MTGWRTVAGLAAVVAVTAGILPAKAAEAAVTATIVVQDTALTIGETSLVTITFSGPAVGFDNADLTVANGTLSAVSSADGGTTWTATLTPTANTTDSTNLITLDNTGVADTAGNAGTGTTDSNNYAIDTARPTASIVVADTTLGAGETSLVTITFSEAVTGFTNADLTVANGTLSAVSSADGGTTWTATLTPNPGVSGAEAQITVNLSGVTDVAGNAGTGTVVSDPIVMETTTTTSTTVAPTTTVATTTTLAPAAPSSTISGTLPQTGSDNWRLIWVALSVILLGTGVIRVTRRPTP